MFLKKRIAIVTTTINVPLFLNGICNSIKKNKSLKTNELSIIVIGDKKSPPGAKIFCNNLKKKTGIDINYFDIKFQDDFFKKKYPKLYKIFPYNDAVRKLLGSIFLFDNLPDKVVYIDDDNYCSSKINFIDDFKIVGEQYSGFAIDSKNRWPNIYNSFVEKNNIPLYPRGFPWKYRNNDSFLYKRKIIKKTKVVANCGFILGDPDIDAVSRLFSNIYTKSVKEKNYFIINKNNFFPMNDQNLCISKEYIALYFKPVSGGRNSDIWTSYLLSKVSSIFNEVISYGRPHLTQIRNKHDYWNDYDLEKTHNIATDIFVDILDRITLSKKISRFKNYLKLCTKAINITEKKLKILKRKKINSVIRHYQNISTIEKNKRDIKSLYFIKKYFEEYKQWLMLVSFYKKNEY